MQPNMTQTAQAIQAQGRGNDSILMHMSPREVGGLQALAMAHGGSLTINPKTGLPEAGFLENILPTLLGVGGMFLGIPPHLTALAVGGIQTARTGDLGKGLMAGLGAFGGAQLGGALGAAGGAGAAGTASTVAPTELLRPEAFAGQAIPSYVPADVAIDQAVASLPASAPTAAPGFVSNAAQAGRGIQNLATGQPGAFDKFIGTAASPTAEATGLGGMKGAAKTAGMVAAPFAATEPYKAPEAEKTEVPQYTKSREGPIFPGADRSPTDSSEFRYFGPSQYTRTGTVENPLMATAGSGAGLTPMMPAMLTEEERRRLAALNPITMKEGGLAALARGRRETRKGMPPRFLAGGGDGMSDSIPAVINGNQPARLADGEFVIPADVVSHLGNGSSKAGAKKLYAMMDRVRKARTGKKRQAPEVNMNRMMPA